MKESVLTEKRMEQIHKLNELAAQRGEKLADMALAWLLQKKEVTSVLIGASKTQQILDNIKAIHSAPFTDEELQKIDTYSLSTLTSRPLICYDLHYEWIYDKRIDEESM